MTGVCFLLSFTKDINELANLTKVGPTIKCPNWNTTKADSTLSLQCISLGSSLLRHVLHLGRRWSFGQGAWKTEGNHQSRFLLLARECTVRTELCFTSILSSVSSCILPLPIDVIKVSQMSGLNSNTPIEHGFEGFWLMLPFILLLCWAFCSIRGCRFCPLNARWNPSLSVVSIGSTGIYRVWNSCGEEKWCAGHFVRMH